MTDLFINLFTETCVKLVGLIPGILALWLIFDLVCGLLFKEK